MVIETDFRLTRVACHLGYITQAIIVNLTSVLFIVFQGAYGISFQQLGFIVFAIFITQIITIIVVVYFIDRAGYRFFSVAGHIFAVIGLILLGVLPNIMGSSYWGLLISVIVYAIGGGCIEVVANPLVDALPGNAKGSSLSILHSFYCWGHVFTIIGTTLLLQLVGRDQWAIIPLLWAIIPGINIFIFAKAPLISTVPKQKRISIKHLMGKRIFILLIAMIFCVGALEQVIAQWVSIFAEEGLHYQKVLGDLMGPGLFACLMGASRLMQAYSQKKANRLDTSLLRFSVICVICFVLVITVQQPLVALLACALCGFFIAPIWPGLLTLNGQAFPYGGAASFGVLTVFGSFGCAIGPWSAGFISDFFGLKMGLLAGLIFTVILIIMLVVFGKTYINTEKQQVREGG